MLKFDNEEEVIKEAERLERANYWRSVRNMAEEAFAAHPGEDEQQEYAEQSVDGSSWIIYTDETIDVLRFTKNDDAYKETGVDTPIGSDAHAIYKFIASHALHSDVLDELAEIREQRRIEPGSLISGTMRPEDLIPAFLDELERVDPAKADDLQLKHVEFFRQFHRTGKIKGERMIDGAHSVMEALFDALNERAPEGLTFGAHPGDRADFGWWNIDD